MQTESGPATARQSASVAQFVQIVKGVTNMVQISAPLVVTAHSQRTPSPRLVPLQNAPLCVQVFCPAVQVPAAVRHVPAWHAVPGHAWHAAPPVPQP